MMLKTAWSYLHSSGQNTRMRQTNRRTARGYYGGAVCIVTCEQGGLQGHAIYRIRQNLTESDSGGVCGSLSWWWSTHSTAPQSSILMHTRNLALDIPVYMCGHLGKCLKEITAKFLRVRFG